MIFTNCLSLPSRRLSYRVLETLKWELCVMWSLYQVAGISSPENKNWGMGILQYFSRAVSSWCSYITIVPAEWMIHFESSFLSYVMLIFATISHINGMELYMELPHNNSNNLIQKHEADFSHYHSEISLSALIKGCSISNTDIMSWIFASSKVNYVYKLLKFFFFNVKIWNHGWYLAVNV